MKIIFATKNTGKVKEVKQIFKDSGTELISLLDLEDTPEIKEYGTTFEENAKIKAKAIFDKYKIPVIGDDSGLTVEQLYGAPGVYSARYAGPGANDDDNNRKLIRELEKFKVPHKASFVCCAVYYDGNNFLVANGEVKGNIIKEPRGSKGFGYDPLFLPDGYSKTTAELSLQEKNKISHRSKAFIQLKNILNI